MKLHFSIRDLLWLTLVIGMAIAWFLSQRRFSENLEKIHNKLDDIVDHVIYPPEPAKRSFVLKRIREMPGRNEKTGYREEDPRYDVLEMRDDE